MGMIKEMDLSDKRVGFALTGSFCTLSAVLPEIQNLVDSGASITPIMSQNAATIDTRFGKADDFIYEIEEITKTKVLKTIDDVEPIGPKKLFDIIIVAPCTGNTISKITQGITDTSVSMAVKAHLRNLRPVLIAVSTNDGLGANLKNIGSLINTKNIFFVPFGQDDYVKKPTSLVADMKKILPSTIEALHYKQIQPVII
jgi:dipicolinate synthase subunit B